MHTAAAYPFRGAGLDVTLDEPAMERAYNLAAIPCGTCVRKHSGEHPLKKSHPCARG